MSLTLVTGVPGSGKTLYSIEKLLQPLIGATVTRNLEDGTTEEIPRTIYTNINGLQLDHELIDFTGTWSQSGGKWQHINDPKRPGRQVLRSQGVGEVIQMTLWFADFWHGSLSSSSKTPWLKGTAHGTG